MSKSFFLSFFNKSNSLSFRTYSAVNHLASVARTFPTLLCRESFFPLLRALFSLAGLRLTPAVDQE